MNPLGAIVGIALLAGLLAADTETYLEVHSAWDDDVGAPLLKKARQECGPVNEAIRECKSTLKDVERLEPIKFTSQTNDINRIVERINHLRVE